MSIHVALAKRYVLVPLSKFNATRNWRRGNHCVCACAWLFPKIIPRERVLINIARRQIPNTILRCSKRSTHVECRQLPYNRTSTTFAFANVVSFVNNFKHRALESISQVQSTFIHLVNGTPCTSAIRSKWSYVAVAGAIFAANNSCILPNTIAIFYASVGAHPTASAYIVEQNWALHCLSLDIGCEPALRRSLRNCMRLGKASSSRYTHT